MSLSGGSNCQRPPPSWPLHKWSVSQPVDKSTSCAATITWKLMGRPRVKRNGVLHCWDSVGVWKYHAKASHLINTHLFPTHLSSQSFSPTHHIQHSTTCNPIQSILTMQSPLWNDQTLIDRTTFLLHEHSQNSPLECLTIADKENGHSNRSWCETLAKVYGKCFIYILLSFDEQDSSCQAGLFLARFFLRPHPRSSDGFDGFDGLRQGWL